jgi:hypothetical protein
METIGLTANGASQQDVCHPQETPRRMKAIKIVCVNGHAAPFRLMRLY